MGKLRIVPVVLMAFAAVACGSSDDASVDPMSSDGTNATGAKGPNGVALGPDGLPVGPDGQPLAPKLDGRYELSNYFDLTSAGIFPDVANTTLKALTNFKEHPSQTLVDVLDAAHVPVVPQVINAIPSLIRDQVLGFIDDHLFKSLYQNVPFAKTLTSMLDDLATITTQFELVTNLDLPVGDGIGDSQAAHTFSGVAYSWQDKRTFIGAPAVLKSLEQQSVAANAVSLEKRSPSLESARLKLGDHRFNVPIGSFAVLAADQLAKDKFGATNLRAAIGKVINCEALADDVSKRCIDPIGPGKICVDHKSEIKGLCETGLDTLVATLQAQIKRLDLPLLHLKDGEAQMWDAATDKGPLDATIDRLDRGFWTAGVNVGKQEKTILATFVGRRIGDVAAPSR
ncbi:MAG TPA: hypothetical protein VLT33_49275 [Labilithrix sp.]|nr:hypothetical protein [Labilithrix sp.]